MSKALVKFDAPELKVIESSKAEQIKAVFVPMAEMLLEFEDRFSEVINESEKEITKDVCGKAKVLRIAIGKVRIVAEKARKEQKEEYLRAGKAIDGVSNILKWAVIEKENRLSDIEKHFENLEKKRLEVLQSERVELISPYLDEAHLRTFSDMEEDVWKAYLTSKKKEFDDRTTAEKKAEKERIVREATEAKERERLRAENEKLRKEAEERDRLAKIETEKREAAARRVREAHEAQLAIERDERERVESIEREKREKLETELKAKEDAKAQVKADKEAQIQADLNKGDTAKVKDLVADLEILKTKYSFKSAKSRAMYSDVLTLIENAINRTRR